MKADVLIGQVGEGGAFHSLASKLIRTLRAVGVDCTLYAVAEEPAELNCVYRSRLRAFFTLLAGRWSLSQSRPDAIVAVGRAPSLLARSVLAVVTPKRRPMFVVYEHAFPSSVSPPPNAIHPLLRTDALLRKAYRAADAVVAVSPIVSEQFALLLERDVITIPNPIWSQEEKFNYPPSALPSRRPPLGQFVFVGRLAWQKDVPFLARTSHELGRAAPGSRVEVIGDGPDCHHLSDEEDAGRITVSGWAEDPWQRVAPKSVLLLTSHTESFGMVVYEALLRGHRVAVRRTPLSAPAHVNVRGVFVSAANSPTSLAHAAMTARTARVDQSDVLESLTFVREDVVSRQWGRLLESCKNA